MEQNQELQEISQQLKQLLNQNIGAPSSLLQEKVEAFLQNCLESGLLESFNIQIRQSESEEISNRIDCKINVVPKGPHKNFILKLDGTISSGPHYKFENGEEQ